MTRIICQLDPNENILMSKILSLRLLLQRMLLKPLLLVLLLLLLLLIILTIITRVENRETNRVHPNHTVEIGHNIYIYICTQEGTKLPKYRKNRLRYVKGRCQNVFQK